MKEYVKPDLFYESFELSQHIAVCAWDMSNQSDMNSCTAQGDQKGPEFGVGNGIIFTSIADCQNMGGTNVSPESYCYTSGVDGINVFNS